MPHAPTALIAEDEPLLAQALHAELARAWPVLTLLPVARDGDEAVEMALAQQPTLLFLDIRMPGRSGLEAAQEIVEEWPEALPLPLIVFVTAYDQYALQAFEACAVDYLLKPVQPERLAATCQRLQGLLARREQPAPAGLAAPAPGEQLLQQLRGLLSAGAPGPAAEPLTVIQASVGTAVHMVPVEEVIYFEAADKYVRVITAHREHLIRISLRELIPQLDPRQFWQVHRGTLVQAREIAQAQRDEAGKVQLLLRQRPEKLAVSRLYAARFRGM
ncbi:MAG TPA: LytTR family DNA-binding domain-containing protein [Ideonella sp.]|nr:LytTR family DNA-binding domain-containing protein [Ideonella sp.]